jgi:hypothetical protein
MTLRVIKYKIFQGWTLEKEENMKICIIFYRQRKAMTYVHKISREKLEWRLNIMAHVYNSSTWEAEVGES